MTRFFILIGRGMLWLITATAILGAAGWGGRMLLSSSGATSLEAEPLPVSVIEVRRQESYAQQRLFAGRIAPSQVAEVGFQIGGEVEAVLVEIGDRVTKGAELARLDPARTDLRRSEAEAQLSEAQARLERASATLERIDQLLTEGFATDQERDDANAERDAALQRVLFLERALSRVEEDVEDAVLRAPFSGFIVRRYVDAGFTVNPGQPVLRVNERAALKAEIAVPASLAGQIVPGDRYRLWSGEVEVEALAEGIADDVDPLTRSRLVRFRIEDDSRLVPGSLIRLKLSQVRPRVGMWVPITALQEGYRGLWSVYVVKPIEDAEIIMRKDVEIISLSDDRAYVTGTLEDGDEVVTTSTFRFVPGQKVRVIRPGTAGSRGSIQSGTAP